MNYKMAMKQKGYHQNINLYEVGHPFFKNN